MRLDKEARLNYVVSKIHFKYEYIDKLKNKKKININQAVFLKSQSGCINKVQRRI